MKEKIYLLDVSGFIFRAYFALPPLANPKGEATHALFGFIRSVIKLFKDFGPDHIAAVFDGPDNKKQRVEIYEKYKAHRVKIHHDLPEQMEKAKTFCALVGIPEVEVGGVEADDTMGSIAKWAEKQGYEVYLCTSDKDLAQLVDAHIFLLNPWKENLIIDRKKVEEIYGVPPEQIVDYLSIVGDTSDNIPGVKGFGPKTAIELLKEFGSLESIFQNLEKIGSKKRQEILLENKENALLSQRLATIYTDVEFPKEKSFFSKKQVDMESLRSFYLEMGFSTLVREMDALLGRGIDSQEKKNYHLVDSEKELDELIRKLSQAKEIALDTEATSLDTMLASPVGVGFCISEGEAFYVPFNGKLRAEKIFAKLKPFLENPKHSFFGHNVKYDAHILLNYGIDVATISFDTILASYLLQSASRNHSLDELTLKYFGKVKIPIKSLIGSGKKEITLDKVDIDKVSDYCCEDVDYTFRIKTVLEVELLKKEKIRSLFFDLELPLMKILWKMERRGIFVNVSSLYAMSDELRQSIEKLENDIYDSAGEAFNLNSPKQLSHILFEKMQIKPLKKTATGYSTNADVLETLALNFPIAAKILEYRSLEKLRSTYIDALPATVNPKTQRIHPTFNQSGTATGRLACQDPNLQNIPVRSVLGKKIRSAFCPEKQGWSFLAADYSQVELRLLAHLSEDEKLIEAFLEGQDIHAFTASLVFNIPLNEVTSKMRHQAKAINFGIIYGQQAYGLSQELGIDIHEAANFIEAYFIRYPKVLIFIRNCIDTAFKTGRATTMIGRERELPEIYSSNAQIRSAAERLAINTPLQGSAADLIKCAMLDIDAQMTKRKMESFMILQVHDELIFEAADSELDDLQVLVKEAMENVFKLKVPLVVDISIGKNWGEC